MDEPGWTTKLPTANGVYWYRFDAKSLPDIVQVHGRDVYYTGEGVGLSVVNHTGGEFLGPLSPSDAEQLSELRKAAQVALPPLEYLVRRQLIPAEFVGVTNGVIRQLRAALTPKHQEEKET